MQFGYRRVIMTSVRYFWAKNSSGVWNLWSIAVKTNARQIFPLHSFLHSRLLASLASKVHGVSIPLSQALQSVSFITQNAVRRYQDIGFPPKPVREFFPQLVLCGTACLVSMMGNRAACLRVRTGIRLQLICVRCLQLPAWLTETVLRCSPDCCIRIRILHKKESLRYAKNSHSSWYFLRFVICYAVCIVHQCISCERNFQQRDYICGGNHYRS